MLKIIITVEAIGPLLDVVQCDLGQDTPVDPADVRRRINDMIDEALEYFLECEPRDLGRFIEQQIADSDLSEDELLFVAPELYLFKRTLEQIRRHPFTQHRQDRLLHMEMVDSLGDLLLHFH